MTINSSGIFPNCRSISFSMVHTCFTFNFVMDCCCRLALTRHECVNQLFDAHTKEKGHTQTQRKMLGYYYSFTERVSSAHCLPLAERRIEGNHGKAEIKNEKLMNAEAEPYSGRTRILAGYPSMIFARKQAARDCWCV